MKTQVKKPLLLVLCIALAMTAVLSGTFAWFTASQKVKNHLETDLIADGSVSILEVFTPPPTWEPGMKVTKKVAVVNNGNSYVLARISFEEVLNKLSVPSAYTGTAFADADAANFVPQSFNADAYSTANGWKLPSEVNLTVTGLPSGAAVRVLRSDTPDPDDSSRRATSFSLAVWYPLSGLTGAAAKYNGSNQRITADFNIARDGTIEGAGASYTATATNVHFWRFAKEPVKYASWAALRYPALITPDYPNAPVALPTPGQQKPVSTAIDNALTDAGKKIGLIYGAGLVRQAGTPTANNWYYRSDDGFFYYIGKIAPGTVTEYLLEALKLDSSADSSYGGLNFDLWVGMEAIQNTKDAVTANDGWNLPAGDAVVTALALAGAFEAGTAPLDGPGVGQIVG
ncbi:MAG: BsaA family SipW-dependent biofilm matrix protein [Oscillospiraceae bacterium]|jgi:hypothetical protein|nr:BsaA family SipW-dependent biofilm matrix protein [Oscillospiraceae bacterium]